MTGLAHLYRVLQDAQGNVIPSAQVTVLEPGTDTPVANTLYSNRSLVTPLPNPFTASSGVVDFYLDTPKNVRLQVVVQGSVLYFEDLPVVGFGNAVAVVSTLGDLVDVTVPVRQVDDLGNVINEGPVEGTVLTRSATGFELRPIEFPDYSNTFAPKGYVPPHFLPGVVIDQDNRAIPVGFPRGGVVHDTTRPDAPLVKTVTPVTNAQGVITVLDPKVSGITDFTLGGNVTGVNFPGSDAGQVVWVWFRQNATTGGRTVSGWSSAVVFPTPGTPPTLVSEAGGMDMFEFTATGAKWRMTNHIQFAGQGTLPTAPTVRARAADTTGASNTTLSLSLALPASGMLNTDLGYWLVQRDGLTGADPVFPAAWGTPIATQSGASMTTWLLRKTMTTADNGTQLTVSFASGQRISAEYVIVAGGKTVGEVVTPNADSTTDAFLDVPGFTPTVDSPLMLFFAAVRFGNATNPTISSLNDWTAMTPIQAAENRAAQVNFAVFAQAKRLTGQNGLAQGTVQGGAGSGSCGLSSNGIDQTYLVQVPPA